MNNINPCTKCQKDTGATWKTLCYACWKARPLDEVRAYRQAKLDRRIARLESKATRLEKVSSDKCAGLDAYRGDIAFFTQPNINSTKGRSFRNYRERLYNRYDQGLQALREADDARSKADWLRKTGVAVKGDAEKRRQAKRDYMDTLIKVGTKVKYGMFVQPYGVVTKVNKKTYTVKFEHGTQYALEKSFMQLDDREGVKT